MNLFGNKYQDRRVLVTGHTGFKGSWLALWLQQLGAHVIGLSLPPETQPNHWELLDLDLFSYFIDIRNADAVTNIIKNFKPEFIFHLAAQPLVRRSYKQPIETWTTNVTGTANLLEACRATNSLAGIIIVTTDKCYVNKESQYRYRETDPLGGDDPYSASKAATEILAASYRNSYFKVAGPLLATVRAGNVIGGGDWSEDRLIPDIVRSVCNASSLEIRNPLATRPWQHVLESLSGYLLLGQKLLEAKAEFAEAWNFGPNEIDNYTVEQVLNTVKQKWQTVSWSYDTNQTFHEAQLLQLDNNKACQKLGWKPILTFDETIQVTTEWYKTWMEKKEIVSLQQIKAYINKASVTNSTWARGVVV